MCACVRVCARVLECECARARTRARAAAVRVCMRACVHACTCVYVRVRACACACVRACGDLLLGHIFEALEEGVSAAAQNNIYIYIYIIYITFYTFLRRSKRVSLPPHNISTNLSKRFYNFAKCACWRERASECARPRRARVCIRLPAPSPPNRKPPLPPGHRRLFLRMQ